MGPGLFSLISNYCLDMSIKIYDTLTKQIRALQPIDSRQVKMYVCGPTVYDDPHIGHLRSAYVFGVICNVLKQSYPVQFVRNVTDIDDKIIERAANEKVSTRDLADKYLESYKKTLKRLGICEPDHEPKATQHIDDMIRMIAELIEHGSAYPAAGNVYFRVRSFVPYGELSHQRIDEMMESVRIERGE